MCGSPWIALLAFLSLSFFGNTSVQAFLHAHAPFSPERACFVVFYMLTTVTSSWRRLLVSVALMTLTCLRLIVVAFIAATVTEEVELWADGG